MLTFYTLFDFTLYVAVCQIVSPISSRGNTKLERGNFILSDKMDQHEAVLEKFAFSNALCLSGENLQIMKISAALCSNSFF